MNLASSTAIRIAPRPAAPSALGRLWSTLRSFFVEDVQQLSLRPPPMIDVAPVGSPPQARDLKWGGAYQDHPGYGCTPQRVVMLFRAAEAGDPSGQCDLFDDLVERDSTLRNLLDQRELAVAGKPHTIQAGGPGAVEELAARVLSVAHEDLDTIAMMQHQLGANRYGWGATEIDWGVRTVEGRDWIVPTWFANVPARRFKIDVRTNELRLITETSPQGEALRPGSWMVTTRAGSLARAALLRTAVWPALWKSFSARDWLVYAEMFGVPLVQAIYDDMESGGGATDDAGRATAEEIVRRIGSSGGATTPKSVEVKIHETRGADNSGTHGALIALANAEMSKLINGSTLANDNAGSGGASYALGAVHASTRYDLVVADAARLADAWKRCIAVPFMRFNGLVGTPPRLGLQIVPELDPKTRLECADIAANKLGIKLSISQFRNEIGFREPLDDSDVAPGMAPASTAPAPTAPAPGGAA